MPHHFNDKIAVTLAGMFAGLALIGTRAWLPNDRDAGRFAFGAVGGGSRLLAPKGRRERPLPFEGPTPLAEAAAAGYPIDEIYATQAAYDATPLVRELEASGTPVFLVDEPRRAGSPTSTPPPASSPSLRCG